MDGATGRLNGFAVRIALFYGALFLIYGTHVPFTPLWLSAKGLSSGDIALILSAPFFIRVIVTPAIALLADRNGTHRASIVALSWAGLVFVLGLSQASTFWPILLFAVPLIICNSTMMPLAETIAVKGMREAGVDYGRVRLWGSLTFIAASFVGGHIIDRLGPGAGIWLVACGVAATVAAAHMVPHVADPPRPEATTQSPFLHAVEPRRLVASRPFSAFLIASGCVQAAHAVVLTYATLIWQQQGMSAGMCGMLWAIAVLAEVLLFAYSGPLLARISPVTLLIAGAGLSLVRWVAMAFDPPLALLIPLQALHAFTYGGSHVAAIHFIHRSVPIPMQGSAQALYATVASGLAMGSATLIAGKLYAASGSTAYLAMAVIAGIGLAAAFWLQQLWRGGVIKVADEGAR